MWMRLEIKRQIAISGVIDFINLTIYVQVFFYQEAPLQV
jgi:hypothetical protein